MIWCWHRPSKHFDRVALQAGEPHGSRDVSGVSGRAQPAALLVR